MNEPKVQISSVYASVTLRNLLMYSVLCEWMHAAHSGGMAHMPPQCEYTLLCV